MMRIALLLAVLANAAIGEIYPFQIDRAGEATAELVLSSPGADWARSGREAAMADIRVDGGTPFQVMLYAGAVARKYSVFLGRLEPGRHQLAIEQNRTYSAPGTSINVASVSVHGGIDDPMIVRAPVLYARKNTIGKFSDVPLLVYAERLTENASEYLQYTVIFSNEDGGTSTRALMARWGRTTDIEYVYRVDMKTGQAIIQGRNHKDIPYQGKLEGSHPLLIPVTDNNMVGDEVPSEVRYQIAPVLVDMSAHSREQVMDDDPITYRVMAKELEREDKLRSFGVVDGHKISDPRNYLYIEAKVGVVNAGVVALARRRDDGVWRTSSLGRADYAVDRGGWIRTTIELPPNTKPADLGEIGFTCVVVSDAEKKMPLTGSCRIDAVNKVFFLDREYQPGNSIWSLPEPAEIAAGVVKTYKISEQ